MQAVRQGRDDIFYFCLKSIQSGDPKAEKANNNKTFIALMKSQNYEQAKMLIPHLQKSGEEFEELAQVCIHGRSEMIAPLMMQDGRKKLARCCRAPSYAAMNGHVGCIREMFPYFDAGWHVENALIDSLIDRPENQDVSVFLINAMIGDEILGTMRKLNGFGDQSKLALLQKLVLENKRNLNSITRKRGGL